MQICSQRYCTRAANATHHHCTITRCYFVCDTLQQLVTHQCDLHALIDIPHGFDCFDRSVPCRRVSCQYSLLMRHFHCQRCDGVRRTVKKCKEKRTLHTRRRYLNSTKSPSTNVLTTPPHRLKVLSSHWIYVLTWIKQKECVNLCQTSRIAFYRYKIRQLTCRAPIQNANCNVFMCTITVSTAPKASRTSRDSLHTCTINTQRHSDFLQCLNAHYLRLCTERLLTP